MESPPASNANFLAGLTSLAREAGSIGRGLFLALPHLVSEAADITVSVVVGMIAVESEGSCAALFAASSNDEMLCLLALLLFVDMDSWVISPSNMESALCVVTFRPQRTTSLCRDATFHRLIYSTYRTVFMAL